MRTWLDREAYIRPLHKAIRSARRRSASLVALRCTKVCPLKSRKDAAKGGEGIVSMQTKR